MFNPISFILGYRWKVRRLRKRWDRLREKTLKKSAAIRMKLLPKEDQVEQNIRILEERKLNRGERARLAREVELDLEELKALVNSKPEELRSMTETPAEAQKEKQQKQPY